MDQVALETGRVSAPIVIYRDPGIKRKTEAGADGA